MYQEPLRYSQVPLGQPVDESNRELSEARSRPTLVDRRTEDERVLDEINAENNAKRRKRFYCLLVFIFCFFGIIVLGVELSDSGDNDGSKCWYKISNAGVPP